jgi:hypothetical protein
VVVRDLSDNDLGAKTFWTGSLEMQPEPELETKADIIGLCAILVSVGLPPT